MDLASIYFGLFLGLFVFTLVKIIGQTRKILQRSRAFRNAYLYMIWTEATVNFIFAIVTYLFLNGIIPGRCVRPFFLLPIQQPTDSLC